MLKPSICEQTVPENLVVFGQTLRATRSSSFNLKQQTHYFTFLVPIKWMKRSISIISEGFFSDRLMLPHSNTKKQQTGDDAFTWTTVSLCINIIWDVLLNLMYCGHFSLTKHFGLENIFFPCQSNTVHVLFQLWTMCTSFLCVKDFVNEIKLWVTCFLLLNTVVLS